ncbi:ral GTPase-activating protein subunit alpha-2 isoform X4 [Colius striatus]|uniref:ral GTPase-activating protein subunit alpha-2 isoform X4 n=1 Tax=Colius striatus TaxID=57412 RepID=UPI002B1E6547|nr:ral GTPase-activating protein subunit alpha-2 isoform X4 [Colius striatus]
MFSRKGHADVRKSTQKALDPKRDVLTRLKHLRALLDIVDGSDLKQFFENNYSQIYFIFYENFITLENSLKQKGNKSQREELDSILFLFEKILQLLPERIFYRWHFRSIGSILKKLLHTGNSLKIRCEGIRLFLLWLQALQTNCAEEQILIFACLVPGFPPIMSSRGPCTLDNLISPPNLPDAKIFPEEITPLLPAVSGEKIAEDQTCYFLQLLLKYMVIQAASLEWKNKENQDTGFKFLFTLFRKYYLPHLFPSFTKLTNIYKPVLDIPDVRPRPVYITATRNNESVYSTKIPYMAARVVFIKWLVTFFLEKKYLTAVQSTKNGGEMLPKIIQTVGAVNQDKNVELESDMSYASEQERSHSNSSTLSDRRLSNSSLCSIEEQHRTVYEMVQRILLSTRGYVNFVNEVFRQAFLLPPSDISATRKVVKVYRKWILQEKPVFMEEPDKKEDTQDAVVNLEDSSVQMDGKHLTSDHSGHKRSSSWGRTYSFTSAVNRGCILEDEDKNVKAGAQAALQVFLTNSANVFLLEPCTEVPVLLKEQVDACKAVLSIFRHMIMELSMNKKTWEQMLQILLRITEAVMQKPKESQVKDTFAQSMSGLLFRTLIVAWIRANLSVYISRELWDELLSVLSALTDWEELINEWANIMDSLTAVLARTVYGVEMTNLPLDKLSEQKEKKQRGKGGILEPQKTAVVGRSFSLSWKSHPEVVEPMRFRSATTSGAPGVEKARNIVRQRATEVEESQQLENATGTEAVGLFADQEQQLTRSSSTSDITDQFPSDFFQGKKAGSSHNLTSSDSRSVQENKGCSKKEHEAEQVLIRRSSSTAELDLKADLQQSHGNYREREKSESVSSDTSIGYNNEVEIALIPWQASEDDQEVHASADVCVDPDAPPWLQLSPSDTANLTDSSEFLADDCSIIAGGSLIGWHPDSAAVLWRRILGILGDVNNIQSPKIHAKVFGYLYELWYKLAKIRDNLAISVDNQSTPSPPVLIPPLRIFASWLFKDILNTVIKHCPPWFFFLALPGFTMLIGDFITAAARVLSTDTLEAPRSEAHTILGSLVCFPNIYQEIPLLRPISEAGEIVAGTADVKCYLINILLKNATEEPSEAARCIAICSLGVWICEELTQCTNHPQVKEAINVIGVTLKFPNKLVAQVACDVLQLLVSYWQKLQKYESSLSRKITEILVATIAFLLPSAEYSSVEADKKFIVSLLLCLLDWCMALPMKMLLEPASAGVLEDQHASKAPLLDYIYRVLHCCVNGSSTYTQQSHYVLSLADLSSSDYDPFLPLGNVKSSEPAQCHSSTDLGNLLTVAEEKRRRNLELIPLTARMVMTHLVNHLSHYPLSGGPAILHSLLSENHDNSYVDSSELSSDVFRSPNLQLFVFNDSTLISYLQIPAEKRADAEGAAPSDVRVIVRDISGKYSWDGRILYGPLEGCLPRQSTANTFEISGNPGHHFSSHTDISQVEEGEDALDQLLERIGNTSPECLLHPQRRLNEPAPPPFGMSCDEEDAITEALLRQSAQEKEYILKSSSDLSMKVACQEEPRPAEPQASFYFCRLLLNDLGMNSWDRRKSFHLLKKNSKLLRELKNLDSRQCRETHKIAVFYIAEGQEDKCSILSNARGSQAYEDFVAGLGWEVDLSTHGGFMGGLQRNGSTGQTAPYYATSTVEIIFHVSTRMPSDSDDSLTKKLRHLGNDEVHIVWSEHTRNYRRGIIPTDFGDVLIVIYPMKNHMFFIEIMKKPEVPFFGPLFDGAIVTAKLLPSLICATCINASRAVKSLIPLYQSFYEERALYLEAIIQNHKEVTTFEDFAAQVFSPSPSYSLGGTGCLTTSASADLSGTIGTELPGQTSPMLPPACRSRVPGKLRRSASALSKASS